MAAASELARILHEEHFWTVVLINGLATRVEGEDGERPLDPGNEADRAQLDELVDLLDDMLRHHVFEESVLFPLIRSSGRADMADLLAYEHGAMGPLAKRLRRITTDIIEGGGTPERWDTFRTSIRAFSDYVMMHVQKEEMVLVQRLDSLLDERTDREMARRYLDQKAHAAAARRLNTRPVETAADPAPSEAG